MKRQLPLKTNGYLELPREEGHALNLLTAQGSSDSTGSQKTEREEEKEGQHLHWSFQGKQWIGMLSKFSTHLNNFGRLLG